MSASGTLISQKFVFLPETRICRACQEIWDFLAHGWRRKLPATGLSKTSSATVAEAWLSTKKLMIGSHNSCAQVRSCNAGDLNNPTRRAVRKTLTHAKTCQLKHKTPHNREIAVAAAHAEGKTVIKTTTLKTEVPMAANLAGVNALATKARANPNAALCQLPS